MTPIRRLPAPSPPDSTVPSDDTPLPPSSTDISAQVVPPSRTTCTVVPGPAACRAEPPSRTDRSQTVRRPRFSTVTRSPLRSGSAATPTTVTSPRSVRAVQTRPSRDGSSPASEPVAVVVRRPAGRS
jgi:hypothetical protein